MARLRIYDLDEQALALDLRDLLRLLARASVLAGELGRITGQVVSCRICVVRGDWRRRRAAGSADARRWTAFGVPAGGIGRRYAAGDLGRIFRLVTRAARRDLSGDPGSRQHFLRDRDGRRGSVEHYRREVQGRSTGRGSSRRMASSSSPVNDGSRAMVVRAPHPACWPPSPRSQGEGDVWRRPAQGASRSFRIAHYALGL